MKESFIPTTSDPETGINSYLLLTLSIYGRQIKRWKEKTGLNSQIGLEDWKNYCIAKYSCLASVYEPFFIRLLLSKELYCPQGSKIGGWQAAFVS